MKVPLPAIMAASLAVAVLGEPLAVEAQQVRKVQRVGIMFNVCPTPQSTLPSLPDAFFQGLRDVGLVDGQNVALEIRCAEGRTERFSAFAEELVNLRVDVLVAVSTPGAIAAKQATDTIPIVMLSVSDPVGSKLVDSLARPGGNATGLSILAPELSAKRLDLLKQALPRLSRVMVLWNSANDGMKLRFREAELAAQTLGVTLQSVAVRSPDDFDAAFAAMTRDRPESLLVLADTVTTANRRRAVEFAASNRIPAIYETRLFVEAGGLMSYGVNMHEHYRRAASYVDRILKRRQARRPACRAAHEVRAGDQHEDREGHRSHDRTSAAISSRPGDRVMSCVGRERPAPTAIATASRGPLCDGFVRTRSLRSLIVKRYCLTKRFSGPAARVARPPAAERRVRPTWSCWARCSRVDTRRRWECTATREDVR
jgi:putative ABC transport system substrate-binding protein